MQPIALTKPQIRSIILEAAGLARKAQFGTGIEAVYRVIDHLGFVQLDTNYVVERAHQPVAISETTIEKLIRALNAFVRFNQCDEIVFKKSNHEDYLETIRSSLS